MLTSTKRRAKDSMKNSKISSSRRKEQKQTEKKRLAGLEKQIHDAQLKLMKLLQQDRELQDFFRTFARMQHLLLDLKENLDRASDVPEDEQNNND